MKVYILYHPQSDHARRIEEFAHEYERLKNKTVDLLSLETREGAAMASLYDVVSYPAILAVRNDGQLMKHWQGDTLPMMDEVSAYND